MSHRIKTTLTTLAVTGALVGGGAAIANAATSSSTTSTTSSAPATTSTTSHSSAPSRAPMPGTHNGHNCPGMGGSSSSSSSSSSSGPRVERRHGLGIASYPQRSAGALWAPAERG